MSNCFETTSTKLKKKKIKEVSGSGLGSFEGGGFGAKNAKKGMRVDGGEEYSDEYSRGKFVEELQLREFIRDRIQQMYPLVESNNNLIRSFIRGMISEEAKSKVQSVIHKSTGINILEELLAKIIPILEVDYKSLTTKKEQRDSFRAHILNAIHQSLTTADINIKAGDSAEDNSQPVSKPPKKMSEKINVKVNKDEPDNFDINTDPKDKFIDINKPSSPGQDTEVDNFTLPGQDLTGRNFAQESYAKIEKNIVDSYGFLDDQKDKVLFYDYLLTNLRLYFSKFETELSAQVDEPNVDATGSDEQSSDLGNI